jgi:hypothetical protein
MPVQLTEDQIQALLSERKPLSADYRERIRSKPKRGHAERELELRSGEGNEFRIIIRHSLIAPFDFSVILAYRPAESTRWFRLRRYNGKSHEHTNMLEGVTFYDFHIPTATERYQASGLREDSFAESSDRFPDIDGAVRCPLNDCGFDVPPDKQGKLFQGAL